MKTSCKNIQNQFVSLLTDEMTETKRHEVQHHLESCAACREDFEQFKNTWIALAAIPGERPDEHLEEQFEVMLRAYKSGMQEAGKKSSMRFDVFESIKAILLQPAWKFAAPVLLLVVGFLLGTLASSRRDHSRFATISSEMDDMRQLVMLSLLKQESSVERLQAVNWSYQMQQPKEQVRDALCRTLTQDSNVNVRLAALRALQPYAGDPLVRQDVVNSFARQSSPLVQTEIIDFIRLHESRPAALLKILAEDKNLNEAVKQHLQWNIGLLEGKTYYKEDKNEIISNPDNAGVLPAGRRTFSE